MASETPIRRGRDTWTLVCFVIAGVALMVPTIVQFYWPAGGFFDVTGHPIGRDFINVWVGPQVVANEGLHALFDLKGYHKALGTYFGSPLPFHNWVYPLFVLPFYWLFAQMPYALALIVWTTVFLVLLLRIAAIPVDKTYALAAAGLVALAPASLINIIGGQNGFISAALLLGGILLLDRRPIIAGILIGMLVFKPHLGICLPFVLIALGAWRAFIAASVTAISIVLVTLPITGIEPWLLYFHTVGPFQAQTMARFDGFYTNMMVSVTAGLRSLGVGYAHALVVQACVSLTVLAATIVAVRSTIEPRLRALVVAAAAPLITPYAFNYDLTALSVAIVWILIGPQIPESQYSKVLLLAWLVPALVMIPEVRVTGLPQILLLAAFTASFMLARNSPEYTAHSSIGTAAAD